MKEQKKKDEIEWDKKKILLFLFSVLFLIVAAYGLKTMLLGQDIKPTNFYLPKVKTDVKGESTKVPSRPQDIKKNIQNEINSLKNEASNINLIEIASSSPQVQKVINDLKAIQNYPSTQLKETCEKICSGL